MTRGNQRDLARAKNAKKQGNDKGKKADDGMSAAARKLRDAEIMQQKQKKPVTRSRVTRKPNSRIQNLNYDSQDVT